MDYDANQALAAQYGVESLPSVVLIKAGKRVDGFSGGRLPHSIEYFLAKNGVPRLDSPRLDSPRLDSPRLDSKGP